MRQEQTLPILVQTTISVTKIDPTINFTTREIGNESISEHSTNVTAGVVVVDEESSSETVQPESRSDAILENSDQVSYRD